MLVVNVVIFRVIIIIRVKGWLMNEFKWENGKVNKIILI